MRLGIAKVILCLFSAILISFSILPGKSVAYYTEPLPDISQEIVSSDVDVSPTTDIGPVIEMTEPIVDPDVLPSESTSPTESVADVTVHESIPVVTEHVHEYDATVISPTCDTAGYTNFVCVCGHSYISDYTESMGHDWSDWVVSQEATRFVEGLALRSCYKCGVSSVRTVPIPPLVVPAGSGISFDASLSEVTLDTIISYLSEPNPSDFLLFYDQAVLVYDAIASGVSNLSLTFPRDVLGDISTMSPSDIESGMSVLMTDFVSVFTKAVLNNHARLRFTKASPYAGTMEIDIQAIVDDLAENLSERSVFTKANISAGLYDGMCSRDAVVAINNWLCRNLSYDASYVPPETALECGYGNCTTYAVLFHAMCKDVGIPCDIVSGQVIKSDGQSGHAWNRVMLSGNWYYIDVCWNDGSLSNQYLFTDIIWEDHIVESIDDVYY